jgi:hypothetical protein
MASTASVMEEGNMTKTPLNEEEENKEETTNQENLTHMEVKV